MPCSAPCIPRNWIHLPCAHSAAMSKARVDDVEGGAAHAHARLDSAVRDIRCHAEGLGTCNSSTARLGERLAAAEARAQHLAALHDGTAAGLRDLAEVTVRQALGRAEEDRALLRGVDARAAELEARCAEADGLTTRLAAEGRGAAADLRAVQARIDELDEAAHLLRDDLARERSRSEADRAELQDAGRSVGSLQDEVRTVNAALRRAQEEVAGVRRDGRQQAEQLRALADDLAGISHGLQLTDGEVCGLQALLKGLPSGPRR
uniref:Uncharacterized protein n=1 Tax=Alexandrium monilatum TaxID=311494 RepID=A0A7S4R523_9DINO